MKFNILAAAAIAFSVSVTAVSAATLDGFQGKVLLDQGKGFASPLAMAALNAGDRIFVGEDSQVAVEFDTCVLMISDKTVFTVPASSPCALAKDVSEVTKDGEFYIEPAAVTGGEEFVYKNGKKYLKKKVIKKYITKKVVKTIKVPVYQTTLVPVGPAAGLPSALTGLTSPAGLVGGLIVAGGVILVAVSRP